MTALTLLVKVTVLLALAAAADRLLARRASAAFRHGLWTITVAGVLVLPLLSAAMPEPGLALPVLPAATSPTIVLSESSSAAMVDSASAAAPAMPAMSALPHARPRGWSWPLAALLGYLAGVVLCLTRLVGAHLAARRLVRHAEPVDSAEWIALAAECRGHLGLDARARLLRTRDDAGMPMTVGLLHPVILLPACADEWCPDRRRAVLLHELAHVARRDCLTQALASVASTVYWFHPGVWWAAARLRAEREFACDDRVLRAGAAPRDYAGHLLEIAYRVGSHSAPALAVTMARARELEGRLLAVMDEDRVRTSPVRLGLLGSATAVVVIALLAAATTATRAAVVPDTGMLARSGPAEPPEHASPAVARQDAGDAQSMTGTWEVHPDDESGTVHLALRQRRSSTSRSLPLAALEGLSAGQMAGGGPVAFGLTRDAGTFRFTGTFANGVGAGTYTFTPSATFAAGLAKRGVGQPSPGDQHELAKHDVGLAFVDELQAQSYETPSVADLVKAGHHGVSLTYVREMGRLGYRVGTVAALVRMRDHGVTPGYVEGLAAAGLPKLDADQIVRARDHGVTADYAKAMAEHGYASSGIDALIRARDHGVTADYVSAMSASGYARLPLDSVVKARDHGVTAGYVKAMSALGFSGVPIEALVKARDHGVTADYAGGLRELGYRADLDELVRARNHGVTPDFAGGFRSLGYEELPLDELIRLRDHGVTPERVKRANERAGSRLPPDKLRALANKGQL